MATSKETYVAGSQLAKSYRSWIRGTVYRDAENQVVVDGVVTLLRRHSIHGTICSNCDNDDPNQCQVSARQCIVYFSRSFSLKCQKRDFLLISGRTSQNVVSKRWHSVSKLRTSLNHRDVVVSA